MTQYMTADNHFNYNEKVVVDDMKKEGVTLKTSCTHTLSFCLKGTFFGATPSWVVSSKYEPLGEN